MGHFHSHADSQIAFGFGQPIKTDLVFYEVGQFYE